MQTSVRSRAHGRLGAGIGVVLIHALVGCALLFGLTGRRLVRQEPATATFDVPLPPPPPPALIHVRTAKKPGAASPRNLRSKAAETVVPPPVLPHVNPPPVPVAPVKGTGVQATAGASDRPGPGMGAGGMGDGSGSGDFGDGEGDGGIPPRLVHGRIRNADYPADLRHAGIGGTVGVRYRVGIDGRASDCRVTHSSGSGQLDALTCRLIEERFHFDPSRDEDGRKVWSSLVENHSWIAEPQREAEEDDPRE